MICTKRGDRGTTGLFGTKRRVLKSSKIIRALGALDEVSSYLGTINNKKLVAIQKDLMIIASILAGAEVRLPESKVEELEREIDKLEKKLSPLHGFILPRGQLMYARALVRKVEREIVGIRNLKLEIRNSTLPYLNRLSDYLFVLGRWENRKRP